MTSVSKLPSDVAEAIAAYRPSSLDDDMWNAVGDIVRGRVRAAEPSGVPMARALLQAAAKLAAWAKREHIPLTPEVLFSPETIERYTASALGGVPAGSAATIRSRLRRLAAVGTAPKTATIAKSQIRKPYTGDELAALRASIAAQPTTQRKRRLTGLMALAAGCGCSATDVRTVHGTDVAKTASGAVQVTVGGSHARTVFCLAEFEDDLLSAASDAGEGLVVAGMDARLSQNYLSNLTSSLDTGPDVPALSVARLRTTWLVTMLAARVPLGWLLEAAGLKTGRLLAELVDFVPEPDPELLPGMFRNAGGR